ncbi:RDD family protein [Mucilaginibacter sp.]|uniref:RDD family protein n=1 Tax=Mucilaginibacter sp. TaxID=1882438 RepID=UPI0025DB70B3|nr:RDD family protein [Mucilaginibacter sp.]
MEPSNVTTLQPSNGNAYFLVINGKPQGPFSVAQLKEHKIRPGDFLKTAAMDDYKEAHEIAELRELLGFRKQSVIPQYFGSFDQRLMAVAIDWFFVWGACIIIAFILVLFVNNAATRSVIALSTLVLAPVVSIIYHIVMECSAKQATFGKQILKIKVCDMQGERISAGMAVGRNLARIFSVATFFVGYVISFFTKQQQALHDMIAGTLVMKDRLV